MKSPFVLLFLSLLSAGTINSTASEAAPASPPVALSAFRLVGELTNGHAEFTLNVTAKVENSKGASLELLSGAVALTELGSHPKWRIRVEQNRYVLAFDRSGEFPISLRFAAAVRTSNDWHSVAFQIAPSALQPIVLRGVSAETEFEFAGAARPERVGSEFVSYLPGDGKVNLSWKQSRPESEGKLFYAVEMLSQVNVSPGLMRQVALLDFKIMQGEMQQVAMRLRGPGEVTRVQGDHVLAWRVEPIAGASDRRLVVQLNQPQKDQFSLQAQLQSSLDAFPQVAEMVEMLPEGATRFGGYVRVVNEGAVRLEVSETRGMSQISPEQFPENGATRAALPAGGKQRFAYRFSSGDFALRIQADQILPEVAVSELLTYHHGENELALEAELELDIREAPLRELRITVPRHYAVARLNASGLSDYFLQDNAGADEAELRLVYGQPISGRQLVQLRLERNQSLGGTNWPLPMLQVQKSKSVRGFIGISSDSGFRLTPDRTESLTEVATAFFPKKVAGLQSAFRIGDAAWRASVAVQRLPQTVQADVFHLFSIGEGVAYGSSVMNYVVSGAPIAAFNVELSDEYFNVEFTGKEVRNWQKIDGGYLVQLHTPVSGACTLLATYERPFKPGGETLAFTGARPRDAQSEQGHTLVVSAYQFQVTPEEISSGLLPLEPGEVAPEYRLFFDAPILAAYRYSARPFSLKLALKPMEQGESLSQVVDRASLTTKVSKEGDVLTDARYFVKNRGKPNLRITLPEGTTLWSSEVNGAAVVPVIDGKAHLIPLPQNAAPDSVLELHLKMSARSKNAERLAVSTPVVAAPVMLAEWKLAPDEQQRLVYHGGSLTPAAGVLDVSGFAGLARLFSVQEVGRTLTLLIAALGLVGAALVAWRWATQREVARYSARHLGGALLGALALVLAFGVFTRLSAAAHAHDGWIPVNLTFLAPVQQAGNALSAEISNIPDKWSWTRFAGITWPALLGLAAWFYAWRTDDRFVKAAATIVGWTLILWATLRYQNGAPLFIWAIAAFLLVHGVLPGLRRLWKVPRKLAEATPVAPGASPALTMLLATALAAWGLAHPASVRAAGEPAPLSGAIESVSHEIRVENQFAFGIAHIRWQAAKGESLPLLNEPAVLTRIVYPNRALKIVGGVEGSPSSQRLLAGRSGIFEIELHYQVQLKNDANENGLALPVQGGLINEVKLTLVNADVDVTSPDAVSVQRESAGSNTLATLILSPGASTRLCWKPRSRDTKQEKPVFYAEFSQLYAPAAGVIEGAHHVSIRPAQGQISELIFSVPKGATITDVTDAAAGSAGSAGSTVGTKSGLVSWWRFDPDACKLRVSLSTAQARPFALMVRSQVPAGTLPFEQRAGLLSLDNASGQIGVLGIGTGNEVQLDSAEALSLAPINLEDYPTNAFASLQSQIPSLTVRRAFRYSDIDAAVVLKASAVASDVRVETQETLSLSEDRAVLAVNASAQITRAGIFRLSFVLPEGFDVESISGSALSHWTESKSEAGRLITLHLPGKTEGQQQFAISLAGPGVKATNGWSAPQIVWREAGKQRGTLLIVPEQGMRISVTDRGGVTQLDPEKSGIPQKGVLAFRILQAPSKLTLNIEQVDPWIQVTSLQHVTITEAQVKVAANLQYQIENTGLKTFHVLIPTNAEGVRFQGDQVADFLAQSDGLTNGLQVWEIKLRRRVIGNYLLQVTYQMPLTENAREVGLRGIEAAAVNVQRGFVTVQSAARLQVRADAAPPTLQPTEWQGIPRALQQDLPSAAATLAYRLVGPTFELPLLIERHPAARLLPARVNSVTFSSVISDNGVVLTRAQLEIVPGDKRLLHFTLPKDARFWFAFVNQNGVWPWRDGDKILIPLEQQSRGDKPVPVEIFYSSRAGAAGARSLDAALWAPKFDLPLENITWRVSLGDQWKVRRWSGALQLQQQELAPALTDLPGYLQNEAALQLERTREAEGLMATANDALEKGDPQAARRAFQAAYGLSAHDSAFNEDARVQLHNLKLQQALVGLSVRQSTTATGRAGIAGTAQPSTSQPALNYTQQQAKDLIDRNTADENAALLRVAERLVQQQDAAVTSASALRAALPVEGRTLIFTRAVLVDPWADLNLALTATAQRTAPWNVRLLLLAGVFAALVGLAWAAQLFVRNWQSAPAKR